MSIIVLVLLLVQNPILVEMVAIIHGKSVIQNMFVLNVEKGKRYLIRFALT